MAQQRDRGADRRQRVAQLVTEAGEEFVLALRRLAHLVLLVARAQQRVQRGDQRQRAHRPFQQGQVAQRRHGLAHRQRIGAAMGQQQDRQVRPRRLLRHAVVQQHEAARRQRLFHRQHAAGALRQLAPPVRPAWRRRRCRCAPSPACARPAARPGRWGRRSGRAFPWAFRRPPFRPGRCRARRRSARR